MRSNGYSYHCQQIGIPDAKVIESALMQDYPNLEIIVSDDCSTDSTPEVVKGYLADSRLRCYRNEKNLGRIGNYKKTLYERVTGEWTLNLDGDDYLYEKSVISCMASRLLAYKNENIVAVMGSQLTTYSSSGVSIKSPTNYRPGLFEGTEILLGWNRLNFGHLAILYNVGLSRKIDYYRLNTISSDWESILRLIIHGKVAVIDAIIAVWNIHDKNISNSESITDAIEDYSYIEDTYSYALEYGLNKQKLYNWHREMVRCHTRNVWRSNIHAHEKIWIFIPYVFKKYSFTITEILRPKSIAVNILKMHPALFRKVKILHQQYKHKRVLTR